MGIGIIHSAGGSGADADNATATAAFVRAGKKFGMAGYDELQIGTMVEQAIATKIGFNGSYTIPRGIYDGSEYVYQSVTDNGAWTYRLGINASVTIPAGWHNGSGYVDQQLSTRGATTLTPAAENRTLASGVYMTANVTIPAEANFVASNIKENVTIYGIKGTRKDYAALQQAWM